MALSFKHTFQSAKGDPVDTTLVRPSNWNAEHAMTLAADKIIGRDSSGSGAAQEISCTSFGRALLSAASVAAQQAILITSKVIAYANIQDISATNTLLGRKTAGAGVTEEISLGAGIAIKSGALTAVAYPPSVASGDLSIKVATTTTVAVSASWVTTTDGTSFQTTALSGTIDLGSNGAALKLDTGTIAIDTDYTIWAIAKSDGTTSAIASVSATSPTLPSGYTFKARIGTVKTIHASATLYGTWQLGRVVSYIVGLAQTTVIPAISGLTGTVGTYSNTSPTLAAATVRGAGKVAPASATEIFITAHNGWKGGALCACVVAPSTAWGGTNMGPIGSAGQVYPVYIDSGATHSCKTSMLLEADTIAAASNGTAFAVVCNGWVENI